MDEATLKALNRRWCPLVPNQKPEIVVHGPRRPAQERITIPPIVVEQNLEQQVEGERPVGARAMLKLARRWGHTPVRAAALLRRIDLVQLAIGAAGGGDLGRWLMLDENLRQDVEGASRELPKAMLLVLGDGNRVHLVALRDGPIVLKVKDEVMSWAATEVSVSIGPGHKKNFRLVEIAYGETKLLVAGAWRDASQRAALELIEQASAAKRQGDAATT